MTPVSIARMSETEIHHEATKYAIVGPPGPIPYPPEERIVEQNQEALQEHEFARGRQHAEATARFDAAKATLPTEDSLSTLACISQVHHTASLAALRATTARAIENVSAAAGEYTGFKNHNGLDREALPALGLGYWLLVAVVLFVAEAGLNVTLLSYNLEGGPLAAVGLALAVAFLNLSAAYAAAEAFRQAHTRKPKLRLLWGGLSALLGGFVPFLNAAYGYYRTSVQDGATPAQVSEILHAMLTHPLGMRFEGLLLTCLGTASAATLFHRVLRAGGDRFPGFAEKHAALLAAKSALAEEQATRAATIHEAVDKAAQETAKVFEVGEKGLLTMRDEFASMGDIERTFGRNAASCQRQLEQEEAYYRYWIITRWPDAPPRRFKQHTVLPLDAAPDLEPYETNLLQSTEEFARLRAVGVVVISRLQAALEASERNDFEQIEAEVQLQKMHTRKPSVAPGKARITALALPRRVLSQSGPFASKKPPARANGTPPAAKAAGTNTRSDLPWGTIATVALVVVAGLLVASPGFASPVVADWAWWPTARSSVRESNATPASRSTLVLVDLTDRLSGDLLAGAREALRSVAGRLHRGEPLTVYVLSGRSLSPRRVWSAVSPGQAGEAAPFREGPGYLQARFRREIEGPLDSLLLAEAAGADTAACSPILEALWQVTNYSDYAQTSGPKTLAIFSDGIQNTPRFSFYRADTTFLTPQGELGDTRWRAALGSTTVDFYLLLRDRDVALQPQIVEAWERFFEFSRAKARFTMLGGAP